MKKLSLLAGSFALASTPAFSQSVLDAGISLGSNFFVALVCGVIIAFAVQYLLTALSVAIGVSAAPNLKEKYAEAKAYDPRMHGGKDGQAWDEFSHEADETPTGVKITSGLGIWNTLTTAIALFTGTAMAMAVVPWFAETPATAITLALTIWGTFFMLLFWLESRFASTVIGGIISTATSGLKSVAQGVTSLVTPSPVSQVESLANSTIDKLEASLGGSFDTDRLAEAVENFGKRLETTGNGIADKIDDRLPSYSKLKGDLKELLNESSRKSGSNPAKWTAIQSMLQTAIESGDNSGNEKGKRKSAQLKQLLTDLKAEYDSNDGNAREAAKRVAADKTGFDDAKIDEYISQIEQTLSTAHEDDMQAESLLQKIQQIVDQNGVSTDNLTERLGSMDRDDVATLIANNTQLSKEKVETYVDQAVTAISTVREKLRQTSSADTSLMEQLPDQEEINQLVERAKGVVANFIQLDDSPQAMRDYSPLRRELVRAMNNPGDTLAMLQRRLANFDADTIVAALPLAANSTDEARSDLMRTLNEAKAEVEQRAAELQTKAHGTLRQAERRAVIEAEHARKTAQSAAWWLVVCIVVSGLASMGGALLG